MSTDIEWERWGKKEPYFGVLTDEKFRSRNLTEEAKEEFFATGKQHVDQVINICRTHFDQGFSPKRILDFGCGVGRLVVPFAGLGEYVVGLDVSESMLKEAARNCNIYSVRNVDLIHSDDNLSSLDGRFDLIHSFIVFQHIPVERGRRIFGNLLHHLADGGICAIQITYSKAIFSNSNGVPPEKPTKAGPLIITWLRAIKRLVMNQPKNKVPNQDPEMQMNPYNVNELFFIIQALGIHDIYLEFTDHGGEFGIFLYFRKPKNAET